MADVATCVAPSDGFDELTPKGSVLKLVVYGEVRCTPLTDARDVSSVTRYVVSGKYVEIGEKISANPPFANVSNPSAGGVMTNARRTLAVSIGELKLTTKLRVEVIVVSPSLGDVNNINIRLIRHTILLSCVNKAV